MTDREDPPEFPFEDEDEEIIKWIGRGNEVGDSTFLVLSKLRNPVTKKVEGEERELEYRFTVYTPERECRYNIMDAQTIKQVIELMSIALDDADEQVNLHLLGIRGDFDKHDVFTGMDVKS